MFGGREFVDRGTKVQRGRELEIFPGEKVSTLYRLKDCLFAATERRLKKLSERDSANDAEEAERTGSSNKKLGRKGPCGEVRELTRSC